MKIADVKEDSHGLIWNLAGCEQKCPVVVQYVNYVDLR